MWGQVLVWLGGEEVTYLDRWVQSYPARWSPYPAPTAIAHVCHGHLLTLQDGDNEKLNKEANRLIQ